MVYAIKPKRNREGGKRVWIWRERIECEEKIFTHRITNMYSQNCCCCCCRWIYIIIIEFSMLLLWLLLFLSLLVLLLSLFILNLVKIQLAAVYFFKLHTVKSGRNGAGGRQRERERKETKWQSNQIAINFCLLFDFLFNSIQQHELFVSVVVVVFFSFFSSNFSVNARMGGQMPI